MGEIPFSPHLNLKFYNFCNTERNNKPKIKTTLADQLDRVTTSFATRPKNIQNNPFKIKVSYALKGKLNAERYNNQIRIYLKEKLDPESVNISRAVYKCNCDVVAL